MFFIYLSVSSCFVDACCLIHISLLSGQMLRTYSPRFGMPGDVVGCGLDHRNPGPNGGGDVFFTLNGRYLGPAFKDVTGPLFPTV